MRNLCLLALLALAGCDASGRPNLGAAFQPAPPPVPVVVTFRPAMFGDDKVAIFSNQTSSQLTVTVTLTAVNGQTKVFGMSIRPNGYQEYGWAEGWAMEPGEIVGVAHHSYSDISWRVP